MENIYSDLNSSIVKFIVNAYNRGEINTLNRMGVSRELVAKIIDLPANQVQKFYDMPVPLADINFDPRRFELCINNIINEASNDSIKEKMIAMEASASMMQILTGMDITDFRNTRLRLGMNKAIQGRPHSLNTKESLLISKQWSECETKDDEIQKYYQLGLSTGIELNRIWAHIKLEQ